MTCLGWTSTSENDLDLIICLIGTSYGHPYPIILCKWIIYIQPKTKVLDMVGNIS